MSESVNARLTAIDTQLSALRAELSMGRVAAARATTALTARVTSAEVHVKPEEAVEPLRMGKVVFHGETARAIRDAQAVLLSAGIGQLEVVKRASEPSDPFVVIDGQVFFARAHVKDSVVDVDRFQVRLAETTPQGKYVSAGIGSSVQLCSDLNLGSQLADAIRSLLRDELKPGGMLHRVIV